MIHKGQCSLDNAELLKLLNVQERKFNKIQSHNALDLWGTLNQSRSTMCIHKEQFYQTRTLSYHSCRKYSSELCCEWSTNGLYM